MTEPPQRRSPLFVGPLFDYGLVAGGLTFPLLLWLGVGTTPLAVPDYWLIFLLCNGAHFAASTVRLYTRPGAREAWPFVTQLFPLLTLAVLAVAIAWPGLVGSHIHRLYLLWSPYHYAAQTFGLALMYCHRAGVVLSPAGKRSFRALCLLPFVHALCAGFPYMVPVSWLEALPALRDGATQSAQILDWLAFLAPAAWFLLSRPRIPAIALVLVAANASWWVLLPHRDAFIWATIFHSLQYLAIVLVFHLRDHPGPRLRTGLRFYAQCVAFGWLIFYLVPHGFVALGFGMTAALSLCLAVINLHHFVVDAFIWRRPSTP